MAALGSKDENGHDRLVPHYDRSLAEATFGKAEDHVMQSASERLKASDQEMAKWRAENGILPRETRQAIIRDALNKREGDFGA